MPLAIMVLMLSLGMVSCNKRCRCIKNNMVVDYYTTEELSRQGKTCSEMVYWPGLAARLYTLCEWEY
jgi:hypothetical protein